MKEYNYIELYENIRDPDENWNLSPDVAGYEYPVEGCNWRIGIVRNVVEDEKSFEAVSKILNTPFTGSVTRNMARVVLTKNLLKNPPSFITEHLPDLEVLINLEESGIEGLEDCYQAIFSKNADSRQVSPEQIAQELKNVQEAFDKGKIKFKPNAQITEPKGVAIIQLDQNTDKQILQSFIRLVSNSFVDEAIDFEEGIFEPNRINIAAVVLKNDTPKVVGASFADEDTDILLKNDSPIQLVTFEIKGAKVQDEYRNQGIYTLISRKLYKIIAGKKNIAFVLSYCNVGEPAVISVAGKMGQTMVTETARDLDLSIKPAIQQTLTDGKLVDEIVTYMSGNRLRKIYG